MRGKPNRYSVKPVHLLGVLIYFDVYVNNVRTWRISPDLDVIQSWTKLRMNRKLVERAMTPYTTSELTAPTG